VNGVLGIAMPKVVNSPFYSQLPGINIEELLWFVRRLMS
jgi:hypothetical protein